MTFTPLSGQLNNSFTLFQLPFSSTFFALLAVMMFVRINAPHTVWCPRPRKLILTVDLFGSFRSPEVGWSPTEFFQDGQVELFFICRFASYRTYRYDTIFGSNEMFVCHNALSEPYSRAPSFGKLRAVLILRNPEVHALAKRNDFMIVVSPKFFL